jgi:DNA polymerase
MKEAVCPDGRLHDIMLYNGADRTGRWSGQGVQPHNFVRGYSKDMPGVWQALLTQDTDLVTLVTGDLMLPSLAKACRGALIASEGMELYAADFNAIEARKLAWLSGCQSLLRLFQTGGDPYIAMACAIYKLELPTSLEEAALFKKQHASERQLGKKAVLGLGYAMGWEKFQATVYAEEGIWLDDDFCKLIVKIYRKDMYPEIPKLWKSYEKAAIAAVQEGGEQWVGGDENGVGAVCYFVSGRFLHCRLPSGRLLAYLDPEVHTKVNYRFPATNERGGATQVTFPSRPGVPMNRVKRHAEKLAEKQRKTLTGDPPESFTTPHLSFMGRHIITKQWQRLGTHGGTLVENADQASSRDLLAEAMYRVDQGGVFDLLLSIHDEVIAEAPIGTASVKEFEAIMSEVPLWAPGMPISAEGWIGPRLRK